MRADFANLDGILITYELISHNLIDNTEEFK